jgi:hypothetical protein
MAEIGDAVNLRDYAANNVGDKVGMIAEVINETNEWTEDALFVEANQRDHHVTIERLTKPAAGRRRINQGVAASKGSERQVSEGISMFENRSHIDKKLVELSPDPMKFRFNKDKAHFAAVGEQVASDLIYGNSSADPAQFNGFNTRYSTPSATINTRGFQLIDGGGTGSSNTSIILAGWGENTVYGIYPKGSAIGLDTEDKGEQQIDRTDGTRIAMYETIVKWDVGLAIEDYRYAVRACNIDVNTLTKTGSTGTDLVDIMDRCVSRLETGMNTSPAFMVNRWIHSFLSRQVSNRGNNLLSMENFTGADGKTRRVLMYNGIPIRRMDSITNDEAAVTGTFASL